jgi:hypothetical protein
MLDWLTTKQSLHQGFQLLLPIGWHDYRNWLTDCFLRRESIEPFGGGIPARYDSIEVLSNNGVIGVFDDGCQTLCVFLSASSLGGIAKNQHHTKNRADLVGDWGGAIVDWSFVAVA